MLSSCGAEHLLLIADGCPSDNCSAWLQYVLNIAGHLGQADIETATAEQMLFDYKVSASDLCSQYVCP